MSAALRLLRIRVQNVGILGERSIDLGPLSPGINVISGSNECGKSSIVRALRAALFQRHGSKHESIRTLRPNGSPKAAPSVEVEFELDGRAWLLEKRFLSGASSKLFAHDGTVSLDGDEADMHVLSLLGARGAGKGGPNPDDMGVWSLLWVNQDELATLAPTDERRMGDHVRASLSSAIGSIVGNVMGGEHGVPLRRAIDEAFERVWTPKQQDRATGALLAARTRVELLAGEVKDLERKVADTVGLGDELNACEHEHARLTEAAGALARAVEECEALVREADEVEKQRESADAGLREASEAQARAAGELGRRTARREEVAALDERVRVHLAVASELEADAARRDVDAKLARQTTESARRACEQLQHGVTEQSERLERMRARVELTRREAEFARARALEHALLEGERSLRALPDAQCLADVQRIDDARARHADHVSRHATRVTVERAGAEPAVHLVTHRSAVALGALGVLTLDPPREGFAKARDAWRATQQRLDAELRALRVESVGAARLVADQRRARDEHIVDLKAKLAAVAPRGLAELVADATRAEGARAELARAFDEASAHQAEATRFEQLAASVPVREGDVDALQKLAERVRTLEALEAASAVRVTLRPLSPVRVQLGARETPRLLTTGAEVKRSIASLTTLTIGEQLEVEIDPGRAHDESAGLAQASEALAAKLAALGVASVDEAVGHAKVRASYEASRAQHERALGERAPKGVGALGDRLRREAHGAEELKRKASDARVWAEQLATTEAEVALLAVTPARYAELDALDRRCLDEEQAMRRLVGRVVSAEGALAARWQGHEDLLDRVEASVEGARVVIAPGEVAHDFELPMVERELQTKLQSVGAATVAEVVQAYARRSALQATVDAQRVEMGRIAPRGLAVLDAELTPLRARAGDAEVSPEEVARGELMLQVERKGLSQAREALALAEGGVKAAEQGRDEAEAKHRRAANALVALQAEHRANASMLAAEEVVVGDAALREASERATAELARAKERHRDATAAWDAAMPDLRRIDLERAKKSVDDHGRRVQALKEEMLRKGAALDVMLPEGRYDKLAEKKVELDAAQTELARVEREARALKLLRDTAEAEYARAQQVLMKPVYDEAMPLLRMIRPGTTITMNNDTLHLDSVQREGVKEEFKDLSGGAREQLAVVVRVALARVFAKQQRAMPLVLDDVLGWTDDRRLRAMLHVLEHTARDMQVILLTCHPERFRPLLGASTFDLDAIKKAAATG